MPKKKPTIVKDERFLATVAYDGTDYIGWQIQTSNGSIQSELEGRLSRILKKPITIHGSGRTDSGVHSVGQTFHFDAFWPHPPKLLVHAINSCDQKGLLVTHLRRVENYGYRCHAKSGEVAGGKTQLHRVRSQSRPMHGKGKSGERPAPARCPNQRPPDHHHYGRERLSL
ncbi:MAG: hypothetical protein EBU04_02725 [Verrucomicrobia bacterium]|nr:hypothetical protein [Verrucomicrobiota bacterium]